MLRTLAASFSRPVLARPSTRTLARSLPARQPRYPPINYNDFKADMSDQPANAAADGANLHKDPVTGEMVSKSCVRREDLRLRLRDIGR